MIISRKSERFLTLNEKVTAETCNVAMARCVRPTTRSGLIITSENRAEKGGKEEEEKEDGDEKKKERYKKISTKQNGRPISVPRALFCRELRRAQVYIVE